LELREKRIAKALIISNLGEWESRSGCRATATVSTKVSNEFAELTKDRSDYS
jgi:hypothetical protein